MKKLVFALSWELGDGPVDIDPQLALTATQQRAGDGVETRVFADAPDLRQVKDCIVAGRAKASVERPYFTIVFQCGLGHVGACQLGNVALRVGVNIERLRGDGVADAEALNPWLLQQNVRDLSLDLSATLTRVQRAHHDESV